MVIPAWYARGQIGGWQGRTFFIALAGDGRRRDDRAAAPLVHVALLSVGTGVGASAIEPMDPRRRLGFRGDAGARWSAHRRRRLTAGDRPSLRRRRRHRRVPADRAGDDARCVQEKRNRELNGERCRSEVPGETERGANQPAAFDRLQAKTRDEIDLSAHANASFDADHRADVVGRSISRHTRRDRNGQSGELADRRSRPRCLVRPNATPPT